MGRMAGMLSDKLDLLGKPVDPRVQGVKVDLGSGQVTIWGELFHKEKAILAALEEDGYQAEIHLKGASQPKSSSYKNEIGRAHV